MCTCLLANICLKFSKQLDYHVLSCSLCQACERKCSIHILGLNYCQLSIWYSYFKTHTCIIQPHFHLILWQKRPRPFLCELLSSKPWQTYNHVLFALYSLLLKFWITLLFWKFLRVTLNSSIWYKLCNLCVYVSWSCVLTILYLSQEIMHINIYFVFFFYSIKQMGNRKRMYKLKHTIFDL